MNPVNKPSFDDYIRWIHHEDMGNGQFMIASMVESPAAVALVYLDKHGYGNVFPNIEQFLNYLNNDKCIRLSIDPELFNELESHEGEDFIDDWVYKNIANLNNLFDIEVTSHE
jgi:hypothetical protein